jgi:hypothetical protein
VCKVTEVTNAEYQRAWTIANSKGGGFDFTLAALDENKRQAQFIGNAGAATVHYIKGAGTWNFVEVTGAGHVMTTTVYSGPDGQEWPMVHSRHPRLATPLASQNRGSCQPRY